MCNIRDYSKAIQMKRLGIVYLKRIRKQSRPWASVMQLQAYRSAIKRNVICVQSNVLCSATLLQIGLLHYCISLPDVCIYVHICISELAPTPRMFTEFTLTRITFFTAPRKCNCSLTFWHACPLFAYHTCLCCYLYHEICINRFL